MHPSWAPGMDTRQRLAPINLETINVQGFGRRAIRVAKVRNESYLATPGTVRPAGGILALYAAGLRDITQPLSPVAP